MMRIAVGTFRHESNTFNPLLTEESKFLYFNQPQDVIDNCLAKRVFLEEAVEMVPLIHATGVPGGPVSEQAYQRYSNEICEGIKAAGKLDGIYLNLHGATQVENIGSGELDLMRRIRAIVGDDLPIGILMDPHANNNPAYIEMLSVVRAYRSVPHTDMVVSAEAVAKHLIRSIRENIKTKPCFIRLPFAIQGEKAVDSQYPLNAIFERLEEIETKPGISIATMFITCIWSDCEERYASVAVTPISPEYNEAAQQQCEELAAFVASVEHDFQFAATIMEVEKALDYALEQPDGLPFFVTDSGDNTTGGGVGDSTEILRTLLARATLRGKKVCVTGIWDNETVDSCKDMAIGETVDRMVGSGREAYAEKVRLRGTIKARGKILAFFDETNIVGESVVISVGDLDCIFTNFPSPFTWPKHFTTAGVASEDYDVIVVKQGYLFASIAGLGSGYVMAMSSGATNQDIDKLIFTKV